MKGRNGSKIEGEIQDAGNKSKCYKIKVEKRSHLNCLWGAMTVSIVTFSKETLSITTFSITILQCGTQHNGT